MTAAGQPVPARLGATSTAVTPSQPSSTAPRPMATGARPSCDRGEGDAVVPGQQRPGGRRRGRCRRGSSPSQASSGGRSSVDAGLRVPASVPRQPRPGGATSTVRGPVGHPRSPSSASSSRRASAGTCEAQRQAAGGVPVAGAASASSSGMPSWRSGSTELARPVKPPVGAQQPAAEVLGLGRRAARAPPTASQGQLVGGRRGHEPGRATSATGTSTSPARVSTTAVWASSPTRSPTTSATAAAVGIAIHDASHADSPTHPARLQHGRHTRCR